MLSGIAIYLVLLQLASMWTTLCPTSLSMKPGKRRELSLQCGFLALQVSLLQADPLTPFFVVLGCLGDDSKTVEFCMNFPTDPAAEDAGPRQSEEHPVAAAFSGCTTHHSAWSHEMFSLSHEGHEERQKDGHVTISYHAVACHHLPFPSISRRSSHTFR